MAKVDSVDVPTQVVAVTAQEPSDHSLLQRYRRGDQNAATHLYLRYAERLRALARAQCSPDLAQHVDVDDIVQSVFGSFFRKASQGCYDVPDGEELWKLFLVLTLNKIRAKGIFHRAAKRDIRLTAGGDYIERFLYAKTTPDDAALTVLHLVIDEALKRLTEQHKTMVELRIAGYEVAEIAEKTGRSKRSVERNLQEFRHKLAALLHEGD
jgi:RNA polymerase sigma-70 factor (ECF subfamily)